MLDFAALMAKAPLKEKRLTDRATWMVEGLLQGHTANSHGTASGHIQHDQTAVMGAYRFLDNKRVSLVALYQPLFLGLQEQIGVGQRAYVLHDVSVVDYSKHERKEDLCSVGDGRGWGYELFSSLVVNAQGQAVGCCHVELRTKDGLYSSQSEAVLPYTDHLEQAERAVGAAHKVLPDRELVHVADREFDDLQLLRRCAPHKFVIRAQHLNRKVRLQGNTQSLAEAVQKVSLFPAGVVERRQDFGTQQYSLYLGETEVEFHRPSLRGVQKGRQAPQAGEPVRVRVVVSELRRCGHKPLRWVLLTNLADEALDVVTAYLWRWRVERLFYLTKVGFKLEAWHQENGARIAKRLALVQTAALVIYQMQATKLDDKQWELIKTVAKLGGWKAGPRDKIGPTMLMRGLLRLWGSVELLDTFGEAALRQMGQELSAQLGLGRSGLPRSRRRRPLM